MRALARARACATARRRRAAPQTSPRDVASAARAVARARMLARVDARAAAAPTRARATGARRRRADARSAVRRARAPSTRARGARETRAREAAAVGRARWNARETRARGRATASDAADDAHVEPDAAKALPSLLRMSTPAAVWYVGWPTTVIGLMRSFFPLTDTFWVGKLGIVELNALCSNAFAGWMLYLLCSVVAYGVQNKVSVKVGAEKIRRRRAGASGWAVRGGADVRVLGVLVAVYGGVHVDAGDPERGDVRDRAVALAGVAHRFGGAVLQ